MADGPEAHVPSSQDWRTLQSAVPSMPPNLKESGRPPLASPSETKPLLDKPSRRSYRRATPGPRRRSRRYWVGAGAAVTIAAVISITLAVVLTPHALTSHASGRASARPSDVVTSPGNAPLSYEKYTNPRYGFSTLWPSSLRTQAPLPNGDGQTWASPDGQVLLSASGRDNALGISPKQDEAAASKGLSQVYSNINGNVVTVSGYKNGGRTIVYQRDIVGAAAIDTLYWSYPATEKTQWDGPVTQTAHAFQPGDLTTPH